jgi:acetolactate synthase-1/3 small subunit
MKKHLLTVLVSNKSGVLTRLTGLFARRGYNIDSLVVCNTENEAFSRMSVVVTTDDASLKQIIKQLDKLEDVLKIAELNPDTAVLRELMMVKISIEPANMPQIESACNIYKAKIIDLNPESVVVEITGEGSKLDAFEKFLEPYGIIELARTGLVALERGKNNINDIEDYNDII